MIYYFSNVKASPQVYYPHVLHPGSTQSFTVLRILFN